MNDIGPWFALIVSVLFFTACGLEAFRLIRWLRRNP